MSRELRSAALLFVREARKNEKIYTITIDKYRILMYNDNIRKEVLNGTV